MDDAERARPEVYARVRASRRLDGQERTREEEHRLGPHFRGEVTLEAITERAIDAGYRHDSAAINPFRTRGS